MCKGFLFLVGLTIALQTFVMLSFENLNWG
jgi:hypothetical protein